MVMIIATIVTIIIGFASIVMVMISTNTYNYNDYHGNHCHGNDDNLNLFWRFKSIENNLIWI